jgi:hypothetical protein
MLRVLTGTRRGWWGAVPLPAAFLDRLHVHAEQAGPAPAALESGV